MELTYDAYVRNQGLLSDAAEMAGWIQNLVATVNMHVIGGPYVVEYPGGDGIDRGLSGVILLAESHIVVHTWPEMGFLGLDLYSCKDFQMARALAEIHKTVKPRSEWAVTLERGVEHGRVTPVQFRSSWHNVVMPPEGSAYV